MAQIHIMPTIQTAVMDQATNKLTQPYHRYLGGLEEVSKRVAVNVAALGASPTNAEIAAAFNSLLTALKNANLQESS